MDQLQHHNSLQQLLYCVSVCSSTWILGYVVDFWVSRMFQVNGVMKQTEQDCGYSTVRRRWRSWPGPVPFRSRSSAIQTILFVLLGLGLLLGVGFLLLRLLLLGDRWELWLADLVSFGLVELLGLLVEFIQAELADDVLLVETQTYKCNWNVNNISQIRNKTIRWTLNYYGVLGTLQGGSHFSLKQIYYAAVCLRHQNQDIFPSLELWTLSFGSRLYRNMSGYP